MMKVWICEGTDARGVVAIFSRERDAKAGHERFGWEYREAVVDDFRPAEWPEGKAVYALTIHPDAPVNRGRVSVYGPCGLPAPAGEVAWEDEPDEGFGRVSRAVVWAESAEEAEALAQTRLRALTEPAAAERKAAE